jgi:predicted Ser/Thr protein kinase
MDGSASPHKDTATKIKSPVWLWIGRAAFGVLLVAAIIFTGQMTLVAYDYHRGVAAVQLANTGVWAAVYVWAQVIIRLIVHTVYILTAIFLFWKRSRDRLGLLAAIVMVTFGTAGIGFYLAVPAATTLLNEHNLQWGFYLLSPLGWSLAATMWIVFPDGRFVPRWTRFLVIPSVFMSILWALPSDSPFYPFNWPPLLLAPAVLLIFGLITYGQIYRYRNVSTPVQQQQTKWLVYMYCLVISVYSIVLFAPALLPNTFPFGSAAHQAVFLVGQSSMVLLPIALLLALTRYRLWDVDVAINRTLVYGAAGLMVALIFAMLLFGLQAVTGQTQPLLILLIAGVVSILIFAPLRRRVQHVVDRNLYNLRFDLDEVAEIQKLPEIKHPGALTGRRLGAYEVRDLLGKGGMGEVYKAVGNGETVAIKTLLTDVTANDDMLQRFQREAETGMMLHHPNIARVRNIDTQDGLIYMVMDYLDGKDLSVVLNDIGKLDSDKVVEITCKLADALSAAHESGMVHRDIKPSNVMLVREGSKERVVLMDFGLIKMKGAKSLTGQGTMGTIGYMAPEQIVDAGAVDHRADIYSLGIMMYEMLIGQPPFTGSVAQILFAHIQKPAPNPREVDGRIPRPLAEAVLKALEKDADRRFQSAQELSAAIMAVKATAQGETPVPNIKSSNSDMLSGGLDLQNPPAPA